MGTPLDTLPFSITRMASAGRMVESRCAARTGVYAVGMPSEQSQSDTPVLDQWRAEVGDEAIRTVVDVARGRIADGSLPGFSDPRAFVEYLREPRRRSA